MEYAGGWNKRRNGSILVIFLSSTFLKGNPQNIYFLYRRFLKSQEEITEFFTVKKLKKTLGMRRTSPFLTRNILWRLYSGERAKARFVCRNVWLLGVTPTEPNFNSPQPHHYLFTHPPSLLVISMYFRFWLLRVKICLHPLKETHHCIGV